MDAPNVTMFLIEKRLLYHNLLAVWDVDTCRKLVERSGRQAHTVEVVYAFWGINGLVGLNTLNAGNLGFTAIQAAHEAGVA